MRLAMFSVVIFTPLLMITVSVLLVCLAFHVLLRGAKKVEAVHNVASSSCESSCPGTMARA